MNSVQANFLAMKGKLQHWSQTLARSAPTSLHQPMDSIESAVERLQPGNSTDVKHDIRGFLWDLRRQAGEGNPQLRRGYEKLRNLALDNTWEKYPSQTFRVCPSCIPNFQQVNDHYLRGGQPDQEGLNWLKDEGVSLVIDFRGEDADNAWNPPTDYPIQVYRIRVPDFQSPSFAQVEDFLRVLDENRDQKVFVHCKAGIGRTGVMTACWRISQGVSAERALELEKINSYHGTLQQEQFVKDFETYWKTRHQTVTNPVTQPTAKATQPSVP